MKALRIASACALAVAFAACTDNPTAPAARAPGDRLNDGGFTYGGGNRAGEGETTTQDAGACETSLGGFTMGGGNLQDPEPCEDGGE